MCCLNSILNYINFVLYLFKNWFMTFARGKYLGMELEYDVLLFRYNNLESTVPYTINGRKRWKWRDHQHKRVEARVLVPCGHQCTLFLFYVLWTLLSWVDKNSSQLQAELLVTSLCRPLLKGVRTSLNWKLLSCISSPWLTWPCCSWGLFPPDIYIYIEHHEVGQSYIN